MTESTNDTECMHVSMWVCVVPFQTLLQSMRCSCGRLAYMQSRHPRILTQDIQLRHVRVAGRAHCNALCAEASAARRCSRVLACVRWCKSQAKLWREDLTLHVCRLKGTGNLHHMHPEGTLGCCSSVQDATAAPLQS